MDVRKAKGFISFDLMIFMLGLVIIVYLCLSVYAISTFRTTVRLESLSRFNWALQIADHLVKFGNSDDDIFHDHEFLNNADDYNAGDYNFFAVDIKVYGLGGYIDPDGDHTFCINRYGVDKDKEVKKLVVCVQ